MFLYEKGQPTAATGQTCPATYSCMSVNSGWFLVFTCLKTKRSIFHDFKKLCGIQISESINNFLLKHSPFPFIYLLRVAASHVNSRVEQLRQRLYGMQNLNSHHLPFTWESATWYFRKRRSAKQTTSVLSQKARGVCEHRRFSAFLSFLRLDMSLKRVAQLIFFMGTRVVTNYSKG